MASYLYSSIYIQQAFLIKAGNSKALLRAFRAQGEHSMPRTQAPHSARRDCNQRCRLGPVESGEKERETPAWRPLLLGRKAIATRVEASAMRLKVIAIRLEKSLTRPAAETPGSASKGRTSTAAGSISSSLSRSSVHGSFLA